MVCIRFYIYFACKWQSSNNGHSFSIHHQDFTIERPAVLQVHNPADLTNHFRIDELSISRSSVANFDRLNSVSMSVLSSFLIHSIDSVKIFSEIPQPCKTVSIAKSSVEKNVY
ncbi:hypothetical protein T11_16244 [Trichinella zimbabwensis]|uniref:Uncharacterized protein n=1 Tax=Trichinella zimbabwensis TaxID=268475 RepID=A0A0V1GVD4_9BILA|nr:hypothetical protein T11_16244 [Trichinella zimbabwensis]